MKDNSSSGGESQPTVGVIYKITNTLNGKIYVGQTRQNLNRRINGHKNSSVKRGIDAAIAKYGWKNFIAEVIETCPVEQLNEREIFWIAELKSKVPNGYNLTDGGDGALNPSKETRAKMSVARKGKTPHNKGKKMSAEQRAKVSANHADVSGEKNPNYGKKTSPEVCAKISAANKGKPSPRKGTKHTPETCAKISVARKGKPSPRKGKKHSEESKAQMRAKRKAWWARKKSS